VRWHPALAALCVALALVATACGGGGGGGSPLQDYFRQLDELDDNFDEETDRLNAELESLSEEEALRRGPDFVKEQFDAFGEFVDELAALVPPDQAADAHKNAVQAGQDFVGVYSSLLGQLDDAPTLDGFFSLFQREEFTNASRRFEEACSNLAQIAAENGITVDLAC
jgi:hypothetical protein